MKKQNRKPDLASKKGPSPDYIPASDFYSGAPNEQPLHQGNSGGDVSRVRKTSRHQEATGKRKEAPDLRERAALLAVLKTGVVFMLLVIALFVVWKAVGIYEESIWLDNQENAVVATPVTPVADLVKGFDIEDQDSRELFAQRIEVWKEAERLIRAADALESRRNEELAIARCQEALQLDPSHIGALERLGSLYLVVGKYPEAINSFVRLLSIDPSRKDLQEKLIQVLNEYEDFNAVIYMSQWYMEQNGYNENVQRYLADAYFSQDDFTNAITSYERVMKDNSNDMESLGYLANAYMSLGQYEEALASLNTLSEHQYRNPAYYQSLAICNAQLGNAAETVEILGKSAHLFGQNVVIGWVEDPRLNPIREDRTFQAFADRVGGEEFRRWLERVAESMEGEKQKKITPQLSIPETPQSLKEEMRKSR